MLAASPLEDIALSAPGRRRVSAPPVARAWRIHVLVIEDDQADASLILSILKRDPRVGMAQATNAPDAILYGLAGGKLRPNLILLDINMPRLNGFKFLDALRQIPIMQDVPVVFLTTSRLASDVERARQQLQPLSREAR